MAEQRMQILGAREVSKILKQLPEKTAQRVVENALRAGARIIRDEAKARVPVKTGRLQESIVVRTSKGRGRSKRRDVGVIFVGFEKPHSQRAHLTEYGTRHSRAFPFMRPALDSKGPEAVKRIGKLMGKGVEREANKLSKQIMTKKQRSRL